MKAIEGIKYLLSKIPNATAEQKEMFVEKVGIVCCNGVGDDEARKQVVEWIASNVNR
jgi:hypothetical protein